MMPGTDATYLRLSQQTKQLASFHKIHDHVEVLGVLEGAPQGDEEGVLDLLQHAALVVGVLDLLHLDDLGLLQHLDGIEALVVLGLDKVDAAEAAGAEGALDGEVGQRVFALGDARLVEGLRLELDGAGMLRSGGVGRRVAGVYQVLYAGDIVRGRRRLVLLLVGVGGVHRVGRLGGGGRRGRGRGAGVARRVGQRLVGLGLVQVEGARLARRRGRDGRVGVLDGRRRRIEVLGAVRVLGPLLLEEAQGRHWRGGATSAAARPCLFLDAVRAISSTGARNARGARDGGAAQTAAGDALRGSGCAGARASAEQRGVSAAWAGEAGFGLGDEWRLG